MVEKELIEYYLRLRSLDKPFGVREAQRILGLNSPGKTQRILNKLIKYDLARRLETGDYVVYKELPFELANYLVYSTLVLPRITVYTIYSTVLAIVYLLLTRPSIDIVLFAVLVIAPLWIESIYQLLRIKRYFGR